MLCCALLSYVLNNGLMRQSKTAMVLITEGALRPSLLCCPLTTSHPLLTVCCGYVLLIYGLGVQLMDVAVRLPPFKPPKVPAVEYEAPQLLPLPELLDEEVHCSSINWHG